MGFLTFQLMRAREAEAQKKKLHATEPATGAQETREKKEEPEKQEQKKSDSKKPASKKKDADIF